MAGLLGKLPQAPAGGFINPNTGLPIPGANMEPWFPPGFVQQPLQLPWLPPTNRVNFVPPSLLFRP